MKRLSSSQWSARVRPGATCLGLAVALAILAAGTVRAQSSATPATPENPSKTSVWRFEAALRNAIVQAGQQLAQQAQKVAPELSLELSDPAVARGVPLAGYGFFFDVQAPDVRSTLIALGDIMPYYMRRGGAAQPVNAGADPVSGGASTPLVPFDPDQTYTSYVREALVDALLDASAVLTIGASEALTIAVSGIDPPNPNPLALSRTSSAKLVMTIRGVDLIEYRQGRLTRQQARDRIVQERF